MNSSITFPQGVDLLQRLQSTLNEIITGKTSQIELAVCCILARGHLLIEGAPGQGKTTLSKALAATLGIESRRLQFTNDLLPSDLLGAFVYQREQQQFTFHQGPVFTQLLLADEINRSNSKTQSGLLEAMSERKVSIEGETMDLPELFTVIATQNSLESAGTFPLPDAQLDRFLMKFEMGFAAREHERALLIGEDRQNIIQACRGVITPEQLTDLQALSAGVHCSGLVVDYLQDLIDFSRKSNFVQGLSTRAGRGLLSAARAYALINNRDFLIPEDIQKVVPAVVNHRLNFVMASNTTPADFIIEHVAIN